MADNSQVSCLELDLDPAAKDSLTALSKADSKLFSCSVAELQDEFHSLYDVQRIINVITFNFACFSYNVTDKDGRICIWSSRLLPTSSPKFYEESDQVSSIKSSDGSLEFNLQKHLQVTALKFDFVLLLYIFLDLKFPATHKTHVAYNHSHPFEYQPSEPMSLEQILQCRNNLHDAVTKLTTPLGKGNISLHRVSLTTLFVWL